MKTLLHRNYVGLSKGRHMSRAMVGAVGGACVLVAGIGLGFFGAQGASASPRRATLGLGRRRTPPLRSSKMRGTARSSPPRAWFRSSSRRTRSFRTSKRSMQSSERARTSRQGSPSTGSGRRRSPRRSFAPTRLRPQPTTTRYRSGSLAKSPPALSPRWTRIRSTRSSSRRRRRSPPASLAPIPTRIPSAGAPTKPLKRPAVSSSRSSSPASAKGRPEERAI